MSFEPFTVVTSPFVALPMQDIDTDRIIPARYLTVTDRSGLAEGLFADWRVDEQGNQRADFPLNHDDARGAQVLVAGENFGCGSSREHAPWALVDNGFRAVISTSIADIFRANALKNRLLAIDVAAESLGQLLEAGFGTVTIDLVERRVDLPGGTSVTFEIDPFARRCLLEGTDELGFLRSKEDAIAAFERRLEPRP